MKRISIAVSVVVLVLAVAILAQTPAQQSKFTFTKRVSAEQELKTLENSWDDATVKHDWAFFDRILTGDYIWTDHDGNVWTKAGLTPKI